MKWFKHDSDANRDPKLEKVLMKYGAEGYALYWLCVELIAAPIDKHNLTFELKHDAEILAHRLKMDSVKVEEIMQYMTRISLFEMEPTTRVITCLKIASRIENSIIKNSQLKEIQSLISENNPGQVRTIPDKSGQVRLEEKRLDTEKKKTTTAPSVPDEPPEFTEFKLLYPKRSGTQPWKRALKAINARLKKNALWQDILDGTKRYAAYCDTTGKSGTEYVMQAATFCGPELHFLEPWKPPPKKSEIQRDKNVDAALEFLESASGS